MSTHPSASQGTPAAILVQPSLSRKGHLLALTKINPSHDLLLPRSTHAIVLERDLKQPGPSAQLLTSSQKSSSPSATSCCHLLPWVAGIMEYLESKKICFRLQSKEVMGKKILCASNPRCTSTLLQSSPSCATPAGSASSACSPQ